MDPLMPPPVRRIALDRDPYVAPPRPSGNGSAPQATAAMHTRTARPAVADVQERMRVESLWLAYGDNWVVRDVSIQVRRGEVLALIGASGSGKTTLLRSLNRLTEITDGAARAGQITLDGQDIHAIEVNELRRKVTMVFQQPNPFPMSIYDNVAYALAERTGSKAPPPQLRARRRGHRRAAARRPVRGGRRGSLTPGPETLRRPAAAPVHRTRARGRARGPAARRALLGARPDLHGDDRGADRRPARERRDRDRHPQPPAGPARRRPCRVHAPRRAGGVRDERAGLRPAGRRAHSRVHQRGLRVRLAALALVALALAGCETTAEKSARLEKAAKLAQKEAAAHGVVGKQGYRSRARASSSRSPPPRSCTARKARPS